jgi:hypothetical protein
MHDHRAWMSVRQALGNAFLVHHTVNQSPEDRGLVNVTRGQGLHHSGALILVLRTCARGSRR